MSFSLAPGSRLRLPIEKAWLLGVIFINLFQRTALAPALNPSKNARLPDSWLTGAVFRSFYRLPLNVLMAPASSSL